jgi:hypothetical protein
MDSREYEPTLVHDQRCPEAPIGEMLFPARAVAQAYPHARPHRCLSPAVARANGNVVIEKAAVYPPHDYVESTIRPYDATRALCRTCRGTHGGSPPPVVSPLLLPHMATP